MPVLPHDPLARLVDDYDSVVPVIGRGDVAVWELYRERGAIERPVAGRWSVGPENAPAGAKDVDPPGVLKPATSTSPFGSSRASEGWSVGDLIDHMMCPVALKRSIQPPIWVTSTPPSASGVSPFGLRSARGGSCEQSPAGPIERMIRLRHFNQGTRQLMMSATWISPSASR